MLEYRLFDLSFIHQEGSSLFCPPSSFKWYRGPENRDITFFTDSCLSLAKNIKDTKKIAFLVEPYVINRHIYDYISNNYTDFDIVLTHHKRFLGKIPNGKYYSFGGLWVKPNENPVKTDSVSIVASNKNFTPGHKLRHNVVSIYKGKMKVFGNGYSPIKDKTEAIEPFRFSFAIENCMEPGYFTEKIIDCFATKTVPIYWGDPVISEIFDINGMIKLNTETTDIILTEPKIAVDMYNNMKESIDRNFEVAKKYYCAEDNIYNIVN